MTRFFIAPNPSISQVFFFANTFTHACQTSPICFSINWLDDGYCVERCWPTFPKFTDVSLLLKIVNIFSCLIWLKFSVWRLVKIFYLITSFDLCTPSQNPPLRARYRGRARDGDSRGDWPFGFPRFLHAHDCNCASVAERPRR